MKPGEVVYTGKTKKGTEIVVRYPTIDDAEQMTNYINTLSNEQTFLSFQGEQNTLEEETKYLLSCLKQIEEGKMAKLMVFHNNQLIASSEVGMRLRAEKHTGLFGISVAKAYRGEGIGKMLMDLVLEETKKQMPTIKICVLSVFATNVLAKQMYEKAGFREYGTLPRGLLHKGEYVDQIYMYKEL